MNKILKIVLAFMLVSMVSFAQNTEMETLSLNKGWKFHLGDIPFPEIKGHGNSYNNAKAGKAWGAAAPEFDDKSWRSLNLPHDWAVEQPFDSIANLSQGYRKRGFGWYRRSFKLDEKDQGKSLELQFDGIATHCTVWVNGTVVHRNWSGYTSFYIDITALAKYGDEVNNIAVRVDAEAQEGWWYEGAGIYRNTWLVKRSPTHIVTDGVFAHPIKENGKWVIPAAVTLENSGTKNSAVDVEVVLYDASGLEIIKKNVATNVDVLAKSVAKLSLPVENPILWSPEQPTLYKVITKVSQKGILLDSLVTHCGFRTIRFDADSGFFLNDVNVKLQGVCNHQDHAGVGVAVPASIWEFRIKKLKEMGVNAYRCAHNPPAKEFLDACDRLGLMVMDENRNFNSSPEYVRQLEWMVTRDRNHPSIILWSVFNEEPMQGTANGYEMVRRMSAVVKELDTSRPVTAAMNGGLFTPLNVSNAVDVVGFNYQIWAYDKFHAANPSLPLTSSEDASGLMVRGEYKTDKNKHTLDSYDTQKPSWGATHRTAWKAVAERPYLAGCFVWTGFDYRGEPTPYQWPTAGSNFGIMDLCGFPKSAFYIHQAQWVKDKDILHLIPHWNWPKTDIGKPIKVMAMSNAENLKLYLNKKLIGEQKVDKYEMNTWEVPYQPGTLEVVAFKSGKEVKRYKVETTGEPVKLQLIADRNAIDGDGWDAMPITVKALDAKGREVATANLPVNFELTGEAEIIGLGNGNPNSHEAEKGKNRSLFNGLAQVIIQTKPGATKPLVLKAHASGLKSAEISVTVNAKQEKPFVALYKSPLLIEEWRMSPASQNMPDPNQLIASNDMNSWSPVKSSQLYNLTDGKYMVLRSNFTPFDTQQKNGAVIIFKKLTGKASIYLNGELVATKDTFEPKDLKLKLKPKQGNQQLNVLFEAENGQKVGLGGVVEVD